MWRTLCSIENLAPEKTDSVYYKIKEDVKSISSQTYPVPKVHEEIFQKGAECLFLLVIIKVANDSGWGAPSFAQPKP